MSVTGNYIDAPTALAWGLVNHVVAARRAAAVLPAARGRHRVERPARRAADAQTYNEVTATTVDEGWTIERVSRDWKAPRGSTLPRSSVAA